MVERTSVSDNGMKYTFTLREGLRWHDGQPVQSEDCVESLRSAVAARRLTRFVGRAAELDQLRQALEQACTGHGQVVAVVGEPGVGKSRLYWEFTHSLRALGWRVIESGSVS